MSLRRTLHGPLLAFVSIVGACTAPERAPTVPDGCDTCDRKALPSLRSYFYQSARCSLDGARLQCWMDGYGELEGGWQLEDLQLEVRISSSGPDQAQRLAPYETTTFDLDALSWDPEHPRIKVVVKALLSNDKVVGLARPSQTWFEESFDLFCDDSEDCPTVGEVESSLTWFQLPFEIWEVGFLSADLDAIRNGMIMTYLPTEAEEHHFTWLLDLSDTSVVTLPVQPSVGIPQAKDVIHDGRYELEAPGFYTVEEEQIRPVEERDLGW